MPYPWASRANFAPEAAACTRDDGNLACERDPRSDQLHELLAKVMALEQTEEGVRCILESLHDRFTEADLSGRHPGCKFLQRLRPVLHVFTDDETLQLEA